MYTSKKSDHNYATLSQSYPEKICINAYLRKVQLICTVTSHAYNPDLLDAYLKIVKDFLIITCAWDQSNPSCLREIKSLKLLYPGVLAQTVNTEVLI